MYHVSSLQWRYGKFYHPIFPKYNELTMNAPTTPITFEQLVIAAQADGDYKPVWRQFVRTRFFAPLLPASDNEAERLRVLPNQNDGKPWILLAQQQEKLGLAAGHEAKVMYGGEVIKKLPPGVAIGVALSKGIFNIPANLVDWMRKSMETAGQARNAPAPAKATPAPAAPAAPTSTGAPVTPATSGFPTLNTNFPSLDKPDPPPAPTPAPAPKPALQAVAADWDDDLIDRDLLVAQSTAADKVAAPKPVPAPTSKPIPVARRELTLEGDDDAVIDPALLAPKPAVAKAGLNTSAVLAVHELAPRNVVDAELGLDFFVPGAWTQSRRGKSIQFIDPDTQAKIEISCLLREGATLENWQQMRLLAVTKDMPSLKQVGNSHPVYGPEWGGRIEAMATEFKGMFHHEDEEITFLVCCFRTDSAVASMTVRVKTKIFEDQRALYKWLFERVNIADPVAVEVVTKGSAAGNWDNGPTPAMFGFSTWGRMGRLRYFVYSALIWFPLILLIFIAMAIPKIFILAIIAIIVSVVWMPIRLAVMRLHDLNRSGQWLFVVPVMGVAGVKMESYMLIGFLVILFSLSMLVLSLWPGSEDENDFGPPCSPNPMWVKVAAGILILIQIAGGGGGALFGTRGAGKEGWSPTPTKAEGKLKSYTAKDGSFTMDLPGVPRKEKMSPNKPPGIEESQIYTLQAGGNKYMIEISTLLGEPEKSTDALDSYRDAMKPDPQTVIVSEERVRVGEFTGRHIKFALPDGRHQDLRLLISGARICLVMVESTAESRNQAKIDMILESFKPGSSSN
jgi:uncharacterized membrane protein YhaH (DUF805 family)